MNRAQKAAVFNLIMGLLLLVFLIILFSGIFFAGTIFTRFNRFYCLLIVTLLVVFLMFLRKKQSPKEVESDERDKMIQLRAVLVAFVSSWILLAGVALIPRFIIGINGSISVWVLSIINFTIFLVVMIIYSAAVLIQYGRGGKDGQR
ncbi:MAG: hypothetical protein JSW23_02900 [Planctomycetota bacterium]|nr:MAG: hypothetical protein JSW23_02900 [Planctomycetota bacterium]